MRLTRSLLKAVGMYMLEASISSTVHGDGTAAGDLQECSSGGRSHLSPRSGHLPSHHSPQDVPREIP